MVDHNRKYKQFHCRMRWNTYLKLKAVFPSLRGESAAHYFERLAKYLESEAKREYTDEALKYGV